MALKPWQECCRCSDRPRRRRAADRANRFFRDRLDARIEREVNIRALLRRFFPHDAIDHAFGIATQNAFARLAAQEFVHRFLDVGFSLHISLIKCVLLRFFPVGVVRRADVAEQDVPPSAP